MKKNKKNNGKIGRAMVLTACVLLPVVASCDRLGGGRNGGAGTAVHFSVGNLEPWGAETVLRETPASPRLVERASVALEDGWVLEADLMEEPALPTRAAGNLEKGAVVRVVAQDALTSGLTESDYVCQSDGSLEPLSGNSMVVEDGSYYFMAYSYNTTDDVPATTVPRNTDVAVEFNPFAIGTKGNDLILGMANSAVVITAGGGISLPNLKHRFSRVKYRVVSSATLTNVRVMLMNNHTVLFTKTIGMLDKGVRTTEQMLDDADYCIVSTGGETPSLTISATIGSKSFSNVPVSYKQPLEAGRSYVLQINVKQGRAWAASNIYWDESKLTFKEHGHVGNENYYQGVYFQWGSLVGISPMGAFKTGTGGLHDSTDIYVYHDSQWRRVSLARACNGGYSGFSSQNVLWTGIPYDGTTTGSHTTDNLSVYVFRDDDGNEIDTGNKGDICRFIGEHGGPSGYRMPLPADFYPSHGSMYSWSAAGDVGWASGHTAFVDVSSKDPTGRQMYGSSSGTGAYATNYGTIFPASGRRTESNGSVNEMGSAGYYWSSSAAPTAGYAYNLHFYNILLYTTNTGRQHGWPVRCIREE
jgi:hypothetical protein